MSDDDAGDEEDDLPDIWERESITGVIGRVLLTAASVEHELDGAIAAYLGADDERWDFVRNDLLGNMTLGGKAQLLRRVLAHAGVASEFSALSGRLDEFVRIRNAVAHRSVRQTDASSPSAPRRAYRLAFMTSAKRGGKGKDEMRFDPPRFNWLVSVLQDDLYAVQRRLDQMWEPLLANYDRMWVPDSSHDPTDEGPPRRS